MSRQSFIEDLVNLLIKLERGMLEFEEPPPDKTVTSIIDAITAFGDEVVPLLHRKLTDLGEALDFTYLCDVLGEIASPTSIPYLIEKHKTRVL
jgi:hypothetical protein